MMLCYELESSPRLVLCNSAKCGLSDSSWITMKNMWVSSAIEYLDVRALKVIASQC